MRKPTCTCLRSVHLVAVCFSAAKLLNVRLWDDDKGKPWGKSVVDRGHEILVGEFVLLGHVRNCVLQFQISHWPQVSSKED